MIKKQFLAALKELKSKKGNPDYYMELRYQGFAIGYIYSDGNLDSIDVDDRGDYLLVYTDTIGITVDKAEVRSI